jgi:hypothetical protein
MTTTRVDDIQPILWSTAAEEVCDLLDVLETGDLTGLELAGLLTILRGAMERSYPKRQPAAVLTLLGR